MPFLYTTPMPTIFLSTPSARRATTTDTAFIEVDYLFLSTPSARRATVRDAQAGCHAQAFLSTPSARRATRKRLCLVLILLISIHALREEGDRSHRSLWIPSLLISIHALREEGD